MIYVHFAPGFEEIEAVTIVDILRRGGADVRMVAVGSELEVTGAHGIPVRADLDFEEADYEACGMMVFPGGMTGTKNLMAHAPLMEVLGRFHKSGKPVAAICAAPMILGSAGLLAGKKATIYPGMEKELTGASPTPGKVVEDGNIITSMGPATAMDFALALLSRAEGPGIAEKVKEGLLHK